MAVDLSAFRSRPIDGRTLAADKSGRWRDINQGLGALIQGVQARDQMLQQEKKQQEAMSMRREAEVYGMAMATDDPIERMSIINEYLPYFDEETQDEMVDWLNLEIGAQDMRASMALEQAGFGDVLKSIQPKEDKNLLKIREETRSRIGKSLDSIGGKMGSLTDNYKKVASLSKEIKKNNRYAVAQGLISLVKLGEPNSAVLASEMEAALNQKDPYAAAVAVLQKNAGSSEFAQSLSAKLDPLNPENVNIEDLMAVAGAQVRAQVPTLLSEYSEAEQLGADNLTQAGYKSVFGKGFANRIDKLATLGMSEQDKEMYTFAKNNPDHEKSVLILQKLGF